MRNYSFVRFIIDQCSDPVATHYFFKKMEDLESELNSTKAALFQKDADILVLKDHIESLKKQNKVDIEERSAEVQRITKKLDEQMQDYSMCKRELEKAISLLEISHAKYKHLEDYTQLLHSKSKQTDESNKQFAETCKSYIQKWISIIAEVNRNRKLVETAQVLQSKRRLKQAFASLKLNTKWEKFIKRYVISLLQIQIV